ATGHVRCAPESRHAQRINPCPLRAKSGHPKNASFKRKTPNMLGVFRSKFCDDFRSRPHRNAPVEFIVHAEPDGVELEIEVSARKSSIEKGDVTVRLGTKIKIKVFNFYRPVAGYQIFQTRASGPSAVSLTIGREQVVIKS